MEKKKKNSWWLDILDIGLNVIIIVGIVVAIRTFLVSPFQVDGPSMNNTLEDNQYIIINKLAYYIGSPKRGDVVVFKAKQTNEKYYVKRVLGVGGDEVILRGGDVFIKTPDSEFEVKIEEAYLAEDNLGRTYQRHPNSGNTTEKRYQVPSDQYFLMGDNRQGSLDSRSFKDENGAEVPFIAENDIKGRVWFVALPVTKIHALSPPEYNL
jgi:signal peptidase I